MFPASMLIACRPGSRISSGLLPSPTSAATASVYLHATQRAGTPAAVPTNRPPTVTSQPTNQPTHEPAPTITPAPSSSATSILKLTPDAPQPYLAQFRLVAYYGSPTGPGLGILGQPPREEMLASLRETAAAYQALAPERPVLPAYHMVITVANRSPPYYFSRIDLAVIEEWVAAARATETAVILDIQPGRGNVMSEFERVRHLLHEAHVHLAIDPEFTMAEDEVPAQDLGQLYAGQVNELQADLNEIGRELGLNRVLILHQFANNMLPDKELIEDYPFVELVIDGDGVGSPQAKIRNYNQYAQEPAFEYGGFKLFPRDGDHPVMTPEEVMTELSPPPVIIIYQ